MSLLVSVQWLFKKNDQNLSLKERTIITKIEFHQKSYFRKKAALKNKKIYNLLAYSKSCPYKTMIRACVFMDLYSKELRSVIELSMKLLVSALQNKQ